MNMRDVPHKHDSAGDFLHWKSIYRGDDVGAIVCRQRVIFAADFDIARGQDHVLLLKSGGNIRGGQTARFECLLVEVDHDDARLAAIRIRYLRPMDDCQIWADGILAEIIELGIG